MEDIIREYLHNVCQEIDPRMFDEPHDSETLSKWAIEKVKALKDEKARADKAEKERGARAIELAHVRADRDRATAERDRLAWLLADVNDILGLCDQGRSGKIHDHMDMRADACGKRDGYGAWMDSIQRMWEARDPSGCFTVGPCLRTVRVARKRIDAALAEVQS